MGDDPDDGLIHAGQLQEGDVIRLLLEQHARIRALFAEVRTTSGAARSASFAELRTLLTVHETAEQLILRPESAKFTADIAADRTREEVVAMKILSGLEQLDVEGPEFGTQVAEFEEAVIAHADAEERDEFPLVVAGATEDQRQRLGTMLKVTEKLVPTHPHPTLGESNLATVLTAPIAPIVDRTRDAIRKTG